MVVVSHPNFGSSNQIQTCKPNPNIFNGTPVIDISDPNAKTLIVEACKEFGFFKLTNPHVSMEFVTKLETEAVKFFQLPQQDKENCGPPNPFGYGNKMIGPNGDVGWVEFLLFSTSHQIVSETFPGISQTLCGLVNEYVTGVRNMSCEVLEMIGDELRITPKNALSKMIREEKSDWCFRLNHYPPCPDQLQPLNGGQKLLGFGEHTDPQIISVARSNNTSGFQICLIDGTWVSIPPDPTSFFFLVGDCLQVMTNGRFRSVKHRVLTEGSKSRVSMIYFGGPALSAKISPLSSVMEEGEESLYKEYTWSEYKKSAYKSKLGDNRLQFFEKSAVLTNKLPL